MAKVSIIIPVYNAAKYIGKCLDYIRNQTLKDIEIILVNDGSTDGSKELCDRFALEDQRIKVIHQTNAGVSAARNAGIAAASGDYIGFSDADDYMELDMYETLYKTAVENASDFSMVSIWVHLLSGRVIAKYSTGKIYHWSSSQAIKYLLANQKFCFSCYNHLIKAQLCKSVKFDELRKMNEDKFFTFEVLLKAKNICCNDVCKYHYVLRDNSSTAGSFTDKKLDVLYFSDRIQEIINEKYPEYKDLSEINNLRTYIDVYKGIIKDPSARKTYKQQKNEMCRKIRTFPLKMYKPYFSGIRLVEIWMIQKFSAVYTIILSFISIGKKIFYKLRSRRNGYKLEEE